VWTYYEGAVRQEGIDEGATGVAFVPEKGWFWWIPLHEDRLSLGVVAEGKYLSRDGVRDPRAMLEREIENNQWVKERLAPARQYGEYYITNEFTHHARYCATDGLVLLGDAYCFLDPVFSSGLLLALKSGVMAADAAHEAITDGDLSAARFTEYGANLREGIENMRKLCYAFYNENFSFGALVKKHPDVAGEVTDFAEFVVMLEQRGGFGSGDFHLGGEQQMSLAFLQWALRDSEEVNVVATRLPDIAFGNVGWNGAG